jgi:hypothetical protein
MEKLKASQDEVRLLKAKRDHPSAHRDDSHSKPDEAPATTESTSELRSDLRAAQKQKSALTARLKTADEKVRTLEKDNAAAAGTIRNLKDELHAERKQRKAAPEAPAKVSHIEHLSAPHKRHGRTKEQREEEEDIY